MHKNQKRLIELAERFERLRRFDADCVVLGGDKNYQYSEGLRGVDYLRLAAEAERLLDLKTTWIAYLFNRNPDTTQTFLTPAPVARIDGEEKIVLGTPTRHTIADVPGASAALLRRIAEQVPHETRPVPKPAGNADPKDGLTQINLPGRAETARDQYLHVCETLEDNHPTDRAVYNLLERAFAEHDKPSPLPLFSTWSSYLRIWRRAIGQPKNTSRAGRSSGASIINSQSK